ncbi:hypothetical protein [Acinetobacter nosocomialis]|uniref:hypothetical protein n=1 Tax=Acinetobacter nosocomialis TaxID=106654 RepID=UPI00124FF7CC|nr:hypothetical protein [Acinetobacter nosocomialis]MBP1483056.1 hypothetical protein [Acinetobacter nosocomialis]
MNIENNNQYEFLLNSIFEGSCEIAIIVSQRKHYFIIDDKENFVIDIKPFYDSYLEKGILDENSYSFALKEFRGGASILNNENLPLYLSSLPEMNIKTLDWMKNFFKYKTNMDELEKLYIYMEDYLMSGEGDIKNELWAVMESRLPKFYLNLDRNLFFHTDWQREFENQLPDNWKGKASSQFWSLIPDSYQYWIINGMNFWKLYG